MTVSTLGSGVGIGFSTVVGASVGGVVLVGRASSKMVASLCRLDSNVLVRWKGEDGCGFCKAVMSCLAATTAASVVEV